jgi:hypothetical protein
MMEEKPKLFIEIEYDNQNYSDEQITEIETELSKHFTIRKGTIARFNEGAPSFFTIILLSAPYLYFCKNFFTKLGEKLGAELSDDIIKAYRKMKQKIAEIITKPLPGDIPTIIFKILIQKDQPSNVPAFIVGIVKTNNANLLSECFDNLEELYRIAQKTIDEIGGTKDIKKITFQYDVHTKIWEPQFYTKQDLRTYQYKNGKWESFE